MAFRDAVRRFLNTVGDYLSRLWRIEAVDADAFLSELFRYFPFTPEAQAWLRQNIHLEIVDPASTTGGGGWYPDQRRVRLYTVQYEAAIHELSHAVWHDWRRDRFLRDGLVAAVRRLAEDPDVRWERTHTLARDYVHGIPTQPGFEHGMLLPADQWGAGGGPQGEWNDWEMYAGLASGCMADIRLLPPYVCTFYRTLFTELEPDAPSPEAVAPHR